SNGDLTFLASSADDRALTFGLHHFDHPVGAVDNPWFGRIDEPAYWNRALSAAEVTALYGLPALGTCTDPATRTFTVDTTPPTVAITGGPAQNSFVSSADVTFSWSGADAGGGALSYAYRVDGAPFNAFAAGTSTTLMGFAEGTHQFDVRARDAAGNESSANASRAFTVDLTPPNTQILAGPADSALVTARTVGFKFRGSDALTPTEQLAYDVRLDGMLVTPASDSTAILTS